MHLFEMQRSITKRCLYLTAWDENVFVKVYQLDRSSEFKGEKGRCFRQQRLKLESLVREHW